MKVVLTVRSKGRNAAWKEEFDAADLMDPADMYRRKRGRVTVATDAGAQDWGKALIAAFNKVPGTLKRTLISAELVEGEA